MANIRKSFNFRSGLQVDNDNFVINANGLVGIGTSIPQNYLLNVYGDTRTTGLTTTRDLYVTQNVEVIGVTTVGVLTASSIDIANGVNVGGALTAATLKLANGDTVDNLIGFARTTFITDNGGVGLHTTSKIGLNTTTSPGASDSALEVFGDANVTGVITATTFSGNVNASSGVSNFTELKVGAAITMSNGIVTATTFDGDLTGNVNSSGVSTFGNTVYLKNYSKLKFGLSESTPDLEIYHDNIRDSYIDSNTKSLFIRNNVDNTGTRGNIVLQAKSGDDSAKFVDGGGVELYHNNFKKFETTSDGIDVNGHTELDDLNVTGVSTFTELKVGTAITMSAGIITATTFVGSLTGTATTANNLSDAANITEGTISNDRLPVTPQFTSIGIGTDSPNDALHIQQSGAAEIYVGSDTDASSLRVGRNLNDDTSGMVKYGNTSGVYPLSTENSLDFMNFGWGNVNFYLEAGITTTSDFNFNWNRGGFTNLMTLTKGGNLGIGITNPTHKLNVQGISTFTGNANFDQNVTIVGALSADSLTLTQSLSANLTGDVTGNVTGNLSGDVNGSLAGISTFNYIKSTRVGIGTTTPRCALDIKDSTAAGSGFVLLPSQTTADRPGAGSTITGALIFNEDLVRFEFWNGTSWVGLTTEA